jgi:hypothetical protein
VVQVTQGLQPDDQVIQTPPDSLIDGQTVQVVQPQQSQPAESPEPKRQGGK